MISCFFIVKVDEQKNTKVVGPFFINIYYDKRRKVVCYQHFKEEVLYPTLIGSKTPPQNSAKAKNLGGGWAAH